MNQSPLEQFRSESIEQIKTYKSNIPFQEAKSAIVSQVNNVRYGYNFFWLGIPVIQSPEDLMAMQELIWKVKPDLIIETGIAWGGSIIHSASMLALLEACGEIDEGHVIGIDIDIRAHNKEAIQAHPMSKMITMFAGSSIDKNIINNVKKLAKDKKRIMLCLDSNHTHGHVLAELQTYAPLVSVGSYCVVGDTGIEDSAPDDITSKDRPWEEGNNPKTAVLEFLKENQNFEIDEMVDAKLVLTASHDGYLKRVK